MLATSQEEKVEILVAPESSKPGDIVKFGNKEVSIFSFFLFFSFFFFLLLLLSF